MSKERRKRKGKSCRAEAVVLDDNSVQSNSSGMSKEENNQESVRQGNDDIKQRLEKVVEGAACECSDVRVKSLTAICDILQERYIPDIVTDLQPTILAIIKRSISKGQSVEQQAGTRLVTLLYMQLGNGEDLCHDFNPVLIVTALDESEHLETRATCFRALGLLNFLASRDLQDTMHVMRSMEVIFNDTNLNEDATASFKVEEFALHVAALKSWQLLFTLIPPRDVVELMHNDQHKLPSIVNLSGMLKSPNLEIRLAAGETIAMVIEAGRDYQETFLAEHLDDLVSASKQLATDCYKHYTKRGKKIQHAKFRDIVRYLEDDISPDVCVKFGKEALCLDSWASNNKYSAICGELGSGLNLHLCENNMIRRVFELGPRCLPPPKITKQITATEPPTKSTVADKARKNKRSTKHSKRSIQQFSNYL